MIVALISKNSKFETLEVESGQTIQKYSTLWKFGT